MHFLSFLLFSPFAFASSVQGAVLQAEIEKILNNPFFQDKPPSIVPYDPAVVLPDMNVVTDDYEETQLSELIGKCADDSIDAAEAYSLVNSLIGTEESELDSEDFRLDVLTRCPRLVALLRFSGKPFSTVGVRLSHLTMEMLNTARAMNIKLVVSDDETDGPLQLPSQLINLARDVKPLAGILDADVTLPLDTHLEITLDGGFGKSNYSFAHFYESLLIRLQAFSSLYLEENASLYILTQIFEKWLTRQPRGGVSERRALIEEIRSGAPFVPLFLEAPSHAYSGLFYRDRDDELNLVLCNRGDFAIAPGCILYTKINPAVSLTEGSIDTLLYAPSEGELQDFLAALYGSHRNYQVLVAENHQTSGNCYLQAGILLLKACERLLGLNVVETLVRIEREALAEQLVIKYPPGHPMHKEMLTLLAKCTIMHTADTFTLPVGINLNPYYHRVFEPSMLVGASTLQTIVYQVLDQCNTTECRLLSFLKQGDQNSFLQLYNCLSPVEQEQIKSTKDRQIPYMQVLFRSSNAPVQVTAQCFTLLLNLQCGGYKPLLTGKFFNFEGVGVNGFIISSDFTSEEEFLSVFAFKLLLPDGGHLTFLNNFLPQLSEEARELLNKHLIGATLSQAILRVAPWPFNFNPKLTANLKPFVDQLKEPNAFKDLLAYYREIAVLANSQYNEVEMLEERLVLGLFRLSRAEDILMGGAPGVSELIEMQKDYDHENPDSKDDVDNAEEQEEVDGLQFEDAGDEMENADSYHDDEEEEEEGSDES